MESVAERIKKLNRNGYKGNCTVENGHIDFGKGAKVLKAEDVCVDETYRIEDDSDPTHQTIIYAISSPEFGQKGLLVDCYGPDSERSKDSVIRKMLFGT